MKHWKRWRNSGPAQPQPDPTQADFDAWLTELISQQESRDQRISKADLARSWDAYLDAVLDHKEEGADE